MKLFRKKAADPAADKKKKVTLETFGGDILLSERQDRRLLSDVPDPTGQRSAFDRRGVTGEAEGVTGVMKKRKSGTRYRSRFPVTLRFVDAAGHHHRVEGENRDLSQTGILVQVP